MPKTLTSPLHNERRSDRFRTYSRMLGSRPFSQRPIPIAFLAWLMLTFQIGGLSCAKKEMHFVTPSLFRLASGLSLHKANEKRENYSLNDKLALALGGSNKSEFTAAELKVTALSLCTLGPRSWALHHANLKIKSEYTLGSLLPREWLTVGASVSCHIQFEAKNVSGDRHLFSSPEFKVSIAPEIETLTMEGLPKDLSHFDFSLVKKITIKRDSPATIQLYCGEKHFYEASGLEFPLLLAMAQVPIELEMPCRFVTAGEGPAEVSKEFIVHPSYAAVFVKAKDSSNSTYSLPDPLNMKRPFDFWTVELFNPSARKKRLRLTFPQAKILAVSGDRWLQSVVITTPLQWFPLPLREGLPGAVTNQVVFELAPNESQHFQGRFEAAFFCKFNMTLPDHSRTQDYEAALATYALGGLEVAELSDTGQVLKTSNHQLNAAIKSRIGTPMVPPDLNVQTLNKVNVCRML